MTRADESLSYCEPQENILYNFAINVSQHFNEYWRDVF